MVVRYGSAILVAVLAIVAIASCAEEEYPASLWAEQHPSPPDASPPDVTAPKGPFLCTQARGEPLPARLAAMSATAQSSGTIVLASDLFQRFLSVCGTCHGPAVDPPGQGGFQIQTAEAFLTGMTPTVLAHVQGSVCPGSPNPASPADPMPPCSSPNGLTYTKRPPSDPVLQLAELVQAWLAAGSPPQFTLASTSSSGGSPAPTNTGADGGAASLSLTSEVGGTMTNIGNCVPNGVTFAAEQEKSAALDAMFAGAKAQGAGSPSALLGLPEHLRDTDLFTLDSAILQQYGVIAYQPGYPLWSDNAGKLRYVRVPRGTSIRFDKATQQFVIPPNTRFYKTFMKQIIDTDGSYRYRKIETRVIVSRPDQNDASGAATAQTALFGTYQWNEDESDAVLVETPLNSGQPFADTMLLYHVDEPLAASVLAGNPADPEVALLEAHAARHYAIPSSQRCVQCHMGSPSQSFVLGFNPLQINRRPVGVGGVSFETGPDELSQLQRLIDLGVITGIESLSDVLPLEQSEGTRKPRNDYELAAQGYMLGNCAHCHNPRGYPSVLNPILANVLDFLPGPESGIFQFPLERTSPRIFRGVSGATPIPYITPSLVDLPRTDPSSGNQVADIFTQGTGPTQLFWAIYAPWRSLIYRNVDNAFAYTDDLALYPHMPMNTAGYDPTAKQVISDWMVSIPAVRKHPEVVEYAYQTDNQAADNYGSPSVDTSPQPYVEVVPGAPGYDQARAAAAARLDILHTGKNPAVTLASNGIVFSRYADPGVTDDILDPTVVANPVCNPTPAGQKEFNKYPFAEHPHWVITDLSQPPGPWAPRRTDWASVLVEGVVPPLNSAGCTSPASQISAHADEVRAVALLQNATLEQIQPYATTPIPVGLWQTAPGCNFASQKTVADFAMNPPHWMSAASSPPPSSAPVYVETPGAVVFKEICINCHGPRANANGRLAQNLATMTGGLAVVADFRDGLFGPPGSTEATSNRAAVFGNLPANAPANWTGVSVDDRAARYMPWMALGGTEVQIPIAILEIVAVQSVLGEHRAIPATEISANMLSQAKALCLGLLGPEFGLSLHGSAFDPRPGHGLLDALPNHMNDSLIWSNGDAELWINLCSIANPPPVHVLSFRNGLSNELAVPSIQDSELNLNIEVAQPGGMVAAVNYPAGVPVGNGTGGAEPSLSLDGSNVWPWCIDDSNATSTQSAWIAMNGYPTCPAAVKSASGACSTLQPGAVCFGTEEANQWAVRGAINAGMSVFLYVESIENTGPAPDYNQCNLLP
jgi:mono/diheme cytochrome c family protein